MFNFRLVLILVLDLVPLVSEDVDNDKRLLVWKRALASVLKPKTARGLPEARGLAGRFVH